VPAGTEPPVVLGAGTIGGVTDQRGNRGTPARAGIVAGGVFVVAGVVVLVTPLRGTDSPNGVHLWAVAVGMLVVGAWFTYSAFRFPRSRVNPRLPSEDIGMPHDPAVYDPADYERRPGYVTEVDGRTNQTPMPIVAAVVAAVLTRFLSGLFQVDQWIAWPAAVVVAVIVWQLASLPHRPAGR
jgi:hypothetical protein